MNFKPAKCPSCGGALQVPDDKDTVRCMYCAGTIVVREAIQAAAAASIANLLKLARAAAQSSNYQEAYDYYTRVLELDSNTTEAWRGKAEACGRLSGQSAFRLPEMVEYFRNAIEVTVEEDKDSARESAAESISSLTKEYYRQARNGLSPAFAENETWILYQKMLGDVLSVLGHALKVIPRNVRLLRTIIELSNENLRQVSYINRRTGTRNWRSLSIEWQQAIQTKLRHASEELEKLLPQDHSVGTTASFSPVDSKPDYSKAIIYVALGMLAFVVIAVVFSSNEKTSEPAQSMNAINATAATPTPLLKCSAYESLTYSSNYDEIVRTIGRPDYESSKGAPEAVIPNIFMYYKSCRYVVISIYGEKPKNGEFNKSSTRYVGTKSTDSGSTLHVSQSRFRALIDALPVTP